MSEDYLIFRPLYLFVNLITVVSIALLVIKGQVPSWHKNTLWIVAFGCLGNLLTLIMGILYGRDHAMSYHSIGYIFEFLVTGGLAIVSSTFAYRYLTGVYGCPYSGLVTKQEPRIVAKRPPRKAPIKAAPVKKTPIKKVVAKKRGSYRV